MHEGEHRLPILMLVLAAAVVAIGVMWLSAGQASGTGGGPEECKAAGVETLPDPDDETATPFTVQLTAPAGEIIDSICIKSGIKMFGGSGHSDLITADGDYGGPAPGRSDCYTVSDIGTSTVSVTRNSSGQSAGLWCQQISHIDHFTAEAPPPTPTPTATPTESPAPTTSTVLGEVLGEIQGPQPELPQALPDTGAAPAGGSRSYFPLLLALGGLALLGGAGTLATAAAWRRR